MSGVRVLVGTRKGAFVLTSDGKRDQWEVSGPHFAGWEIYHLKGSPVDPNRLYASQTSGWFGQIIQRSDDGGKTWHQPGTPPGEPTTTPDGMPKGESNKFVYDTSPETGKPLTTHQWYDGTQHPWEFKRVWHLEPSLTDPDTVYAGVEDAALFRSTDGGTDLAGAGRPARSRHGAHVAAGRRRDVPAHDPPRPDQSRTDLHRHLGRGRVPHRRRRPDVEADQPGPAFAVHPRPDGRGRPLRAPHRACTRRVRTCCSCRSTGTSCAATTPASRGARSAATCRPTSASRSTSTPTSRRRSTSCRSRATPSTTRPTASCASTAAGPAATSGRRSRTACRSATATSTCCATRWPSTRSIRAACTSAPPAGRSTPRPTAATTGRRSSAICRPCCPSRCRRCR